MSIFRTMRTRREQKRANRFIKSLKNKDEKQIERALLNNKEFENNDIVLRYLFFNYTSLIRILPIEFQKTRINSNLSMFEFGSDEAKKELVSSWLKENKFFMNANSIGMNEDDFKKYIKLYFHQPDDVALLYMDDLRRTISILSESDLKQTEELISKIKDKLTDRQWKFIIEVNPSFIRYASQEIQNEHCDDEKYITFLSGEARDKYIEKQLEKLSSDTSSIDDLDVDIQRAYVEKYPYMANYLSSHVIANVLKYDIELIKFVNLTLLQDKEDKTQEVMCSILDNIEIKTPKELVNILVNKCALNAKGKLYRFDFESNNINYQYTKKIMKILQKLSVEQIIVLIMVDANYILPYISPLYSDEEEESIKEKIIIDCNSRCLNVFKKYYGEEIYNNYYKLINKIFTFYSSDKEKYDFSYDYDCVLELLKVLFNKKIIENNKIEKITSFIEISLKNKGNNGKNKKEAIALLNELLSNAYNVKIDNTREIYNINSLELFDSKFSFISKELLLDFTKYNFVNVSDLLLISKSEKVLELFKKFYDIILYIYSESKETLYKAIENFAYYKDILMDLDDKKLEEENVNDFVNLITTYDNQYNICKKEELDNYEILCLKRLVKDVSTIIDESVCKNVLSNYLFNKGYDEKGNGGWLVTDTIKSLCNVFEIDGLYNLKIDGEKVFTEDEVKAFIMIKLLFDSSDLDLLFSFIQNILNNKVKRNVLSFFDLFDKFKKYRFELINDQIVTLEDIEDLYAERPDVVMKTTREGVDVYTIVGQNFKVLCAKNEDNNFNCENILNINNNVYVYDRLLDKESTKFTIKDDKTLIRLTNYNSKIMKPSYMLIKEKVNFNLVEIAKEKNLTIVEVQED